MVDDAGAAVLDPAEAAAERRLDPSLHGVGLVGGHPPAALGLRVARPPRRRGHRRRPLAAAAVPRRPRRRAPELLQIPHCLSVCCLCRERNATCRDARVCSWSTESGLALYIDRVMRR